MAINLDGFFKPIQNDVISNPNPRIAKNTTIKKGSVITFNYTMWRNDPYPLIIVTSYTPNNKIWGVNLHYLTFNYIKKLLKNCDNPIFSYNIIKDDKYIVKAFRSYKWTGVRQVKVLDCAFLLNIMSVVRNTDVADVQIIRKQVQEQIRKRINPKADELSEQGEQIQPSIPNKNAAPDVKTVPTTPIVGQG